jgi:hypothetical protein
MVASTVSFVAQSPPTPPPTVFDRRSKGPSVVGGTQPAAQPWVAAVGGCATLDGREDGVYDL